MEAATEIKAKPAAAVKTMSARGGATVLGSFKFLGVKRMPGDTITAEELGRVSFPVIKALLDSRQLELAGAAPVGAGLSEADREMLQGVSARVERLTEMVSALTSDVGKLKKPKTGAGE